MGMLLHRQGESRRKKLLPETPPAEVGGENKEQTGAGSAAEQDNGRSGGTKPPSPKGKK